MKLSLLIAILFVALVGLSAPYVHAVEYNAEGIPQWDGTPNCSDLKNPTQAICCGVIMVGLAQHPEYKPTSHGVVIPWQSTQAASCPAGYRPSATQCIGHPAWCEPETQSSTAQ